MMFIENLKYYYTGNEKIIQNTGILSVLYSGWFKSSDRCPVIYDVAAPQPPNHRPIASSILLAVLSARPWRQATRYRIMDRKVSRNDGCQPSESKNSFKTSRYLHQGLHWSSLKIQRKKYSKNFNKFFFFLHQ